MSCPTRPLEQLEALQVARGHPWKVQSGLSLAGAAALAKANRKQRYGCTFATAITVLDRTARVGGRMTGSSSNFQLLSFAFRYSTLVIIRSGSRRARRDPAAAGRAAATARQLAPRPLRMLRNPVESGVDLWPEAQCDWMGRDLANKGTRLDEWKQHLRLRGMQRPPFHVRISTQTRLFEVGKSAIFLTSRYHPL